MANGVGVRTEAIAPVEGVRELPLMLANVSAILERRPTRSRWALGELAPALGAVARSIHRGHITPSQLADVRSRAAALQREAGA